MLTTLLALGVALVAGPSPSGPVSPAAPLDVAEIAGVWAGTLTHAGETEPFALELEPGGTARSSSACRCRSRTSTGPRSAASTPW